MKFIIIILAFAVLITGSWKAKQYIDSKDKALEIKGQIAEEKHEDIQVDFKRFVTEYIRKHLKYSESILFHEVATQELSASKIKVMFTYSFKEKNKDIGDTSTKIRGFAILNQDKKSAGEEIENWLMDELHVSNQQLIFERGIEFKIGAKDEEIVKEDPDKDKK